MNYEDDLTSERKVDSEESPVNSKAAAIRPSSTKDLEPGLDFEEPPVNYEADAAKSKSKLRVIYTNKKIIINKHCCVRCFMYL